MTNLENAKRAWENYQNWNNQWVNACNSNARLEHCWKLNDYMLKARARWEKASYSLSHAQLMEVTREAA